MLPFSYDILYKFMQFIIIHTKIFESLQPNYTNKYGYIFK